MCRYAFHTYKSHYACFRCRKMFRQTPLADLPEYHRPDYRQNRPLPCPECGQPMRDMGMNFKAPRQPNVQQWRKVETLYAHGLTWHDCGCGSGPAVSTLGELKPFLERLERRRDEEEQARQKGIKNTWRETKRKKHHSFRKPQPVRWEFYSAKTTER